MNTHETRPILVGVDGSPSAGRALAWAVADAERRGRRLHILHALEIPPYDLPLLGAPGVADSLREGAMRVLADAERAARAQAPDVEVTAKLVEAHAVHALCDRSAGVLETVVGHRGRGGFAEMLLGSVGLGVAEGSESPVVVVRGGEGRSSGRSGDGEVAVGLALDGDDAALEFAFAEAAARGASVRTVHAALGPRLAVDAMRQNADEERLLWALLEAHAPLRKRFPDVPVTESVVWDDPVTAMVDASRTADLVVVGRRHRPGPVWRALGSVGHGTVRHAACPVAVVPATA
ncbi:universal stress protein [Actinomadura logoneensis]|uniref:Universal stress protein n=1 Tax=Actinomadura logoneensis TaxID=2293572 RepID=A0A372JHS1_9ACTN|nr:universal stress protein [Actinomadura logoneensis]RFU39575.1 universal stress protein [Actinomadura logoneensis]